MNIDVAKQLIDLNRQFYQTFALNFSSTRGRLQPGVRKIIDSLSPKLRILDLGSGNGELWRELQRRNHLGAYTGLDFSPELTKIADHTVSTTRSPESTFVIGDLSANDWEKFIPNPPFDIVFAFAVLHHIPSHVLRLQILQKINQLLVPEGQLIHSVWQFLNSPRLRDRIQPWESMGLSQQQVDDGDFLLDWRLGGNALRYVHFFTQTELDELARQSGFFVIDSFASDGFEGNLGLYQIWKQIV